MSRPLCAAAAEGGFPAQPPGEMKKVLHSFLSRVTSRISLVMLITLPATGGTRRKSRILAGRDRGRGLHLVPLGLAPGEPRGLASLSLLGPGALPGLWDQGAARTLHSNQAQ